MPIAVLNEQVADVNYRQLTVLSERLHGGWPNEIPLLRENCLQAKRKLVP